MIELLLKFKKISNISKKKIGPVFTISNYLEIITIWSRKIEADKTLKNIYLFSPITATANNSKGYS